MFSSFYRNNGMCMQKIKIQILAIICSVFFVGVIFAKDVRIKEVRFEENSVVVINGAVFTSTQIVFSKDEIVNDVEGGDTAGWIVTYHPKLKNMLFIKPTVLDSDTNMTVITNKHHYYFHITSNKALTVVPQQLTYAVKFIYPKSLMPNPGVKKPLQSHNNEKSKISASINKYYSFNGSELLKPLHVFDDGQFTFFEFEKNQAIPAIFAIDDKRGKESVTNIRKEGNYIVVQRLAPQFTLRHGALVASIFNDIEIMRLKCKQV